MNEVRLGVLVSGSGTILDAMIAKGLTVSLVVADRQCRALDVARRAGVEALLVDRANFGGFRVDFDRVAYSEALSETLRARDVTLVAMAGFGTVVTSALHEDYPGRVLNTHPSLLPAFQGWHAVAHALEAGVEETGCTVHVATLELDAGPILAQRRVAIHVGDDEASLHERIKSVERELYPVVVDRVMAFMSRGLEPRDVVGTLEES